MKNRVPLVDQAQPFGVVHNFQAHPSTPINGSNPPKSLGPETERKNNGANHAPGFGSKNVRAPQINPFAPCGKAK